MALFQKDSVSVEPAHLSFRGGQVWSPEVSPQLLLLYNVDESTGSFCLFVDLLPVEHSNSRQASGLPMAARPHPKP